MSSEPFKVSYLSDDDSGTITWRCPSNIALIKYWGKRGHQLPSNPSLSFTLSECYTQTTLEYEYIEALTAPGVHFISADSRDQAFGERVVTYIENLILDIPVLSKMRLTIRSENNFPHSAGIASSASAFGALALCLCSLEKKVTGEISGSPDFNRKASYLARLGSGSASRSIYGGYVLWGEADEHPNASNQYAIPVPYEVHPAFQSLQDTILIVSSEKKKLSSSQGHDLMKSHPYAFCRYDQARDNLNRLTLALKTGDMDSFIKTVEHEALSLHGLILSSGNGQILLKPGSLAIIEKVIQFREETSLPLCFTIDAGPNIHLLYPNEFGEKIVSFIRSDLLSYCEQNRFIEDRMGTGPVQL